MKEFLKDKNRMLIIALAAVVVLSVATYAAISVDNFGGGYEPPSALNIRWGDYFTSSSMTSINIANSVTQWPRWTAEYPYRAIFIGMGSDGSQYNPPNSCMPFMFVVYSKKSATDLFTFEYIDGIRSGGSNKRGYIRASIASDKYNTVTYYPEEKRSDVWIMYGGFDFPNFSNTVVVGDMVGYVGYPLFVSGSNHYFEFDFYYECAGEHQQNAYPLNIDGLRSVANVPYGYILKCEEHAPPGGSASGGGSSSSGGGSSGGGSSNGNSNGSGGRPGWGGGENGGGVDRNEISSHNDGGSYPDRNDMEVSVPDDWKKPVEDNYSGGLNSEYKPDYPAYTPAEGDTGQNGENWELPGFDLNNDGVSGEINGYRDLIPGGGQGYIELQPGISDWGYVELIPDGEYGLIDFMNP